jgi:WD40 repeat protein
MKNPATTTATTPQLPTGTWSVALRDQLAKEAIAQMGPNASEELKCAVMEQLVQKLTALRDYDLFDPKQLESVVLKRNYREVGRVQVGSFVLALQVLPDGRIVSGCEDGRIRILAKEADGQWSAELLSRHTDWLLCLQYLPDGRIVSGSDDTTIRIWTKSAEGEWSSEVLSGHARGVQCLQALPDGRIVSGSDDKTIRIWTKGAEGEWSSEVLSGHALGIQCLQALPDGRIVSGSYDGTIRIWTTRKDSPIRSFVRDWWPIPPFSQWDSEQLCGHIADVECLKVHPDGRIFSGSLDDTIRIWDGDEIAGGTS